MADVEDLRSASEEEEEESEDEYAYESEASTDPVADAGDQLDVDVARCCARFGDESAERSTILTDMGAMCSSATSPSTLLGTRSSSQIRNDRLDFFWSGDLAIWR